MITVAGDVVPVHCWYCLLNTNQKIVHRVMLVESIGTLHNSVA